jgi:hypothetical protein
LLGDVGEGSVAVVAEQLSRSFDVWIEFAADVEIQVAVVVEVRPGRGLRRAVGFAEPGLEGDVGERAVAVVVQQRVGMPAVLPPPGASQHEEVVVTIIVIIGMDDVQAANDPGQSGLSRPLGERSIPVAVEEAQLPRRIRRRDHDVEESVAVEVIDRRAPCDIKTVQSEPWGHVEETWNLLVGNEGLRIDPIRGRDAVGIGAERHVRHVE